MIELVQKVLTQVNAKGYKSLAMPALGTGHVSYPKMTAARCVYDAILDWAGKNPGATLKLVRLVMYSKDTEAQQVGDWRFCVDLWMDA